MNIITYDSLRHFADSWGLVYMMAIFLAVLFFVLRPGAGQSAREAAAIPLNDNQPMRPEDKP